MGLKCSLLGHTFDEADVEREREERGSEVVTIIREVERCGNCGRTRTVSENKEVTSVIEPNEDAAENPPTASSGAADAEGVQLDESRQPDEEDAEILRDDRDTGRAPGQWPDDEEPWKPPASGDDADGDDVAGETATGTTDRDQAETESGNETEAGVQDDSLARDDDHAEVLDDGSAHAATGSTPTDGTVTGLDGPSGGSSDDSDIIEAGEDEVPPEKSGRARPQSDSTTVPESGLVCPECGFSTTGTSSSLRVGDACPECQRDYLETERNP